MAQVLLGGDRIAHGHHILHAVLLDIACGHGKVLRRKQGGNGAQLQHTGEVRLGQGRRAALLQCGQARIQLGQGQVYLNAAGNELLGPLRQGHGSGGDLLHQARQNGVIRLELPDLFLELTELLRCFLDFLPQMVPVRTQGLQAQVDLRQLGGDADIFALGLDGGDLLLLLLGRQEGVILNGGDAGIVAGLFCLQLGFPLQKLLKQGQSFPEGLLLDIHFPEAIPDGQKSLFRRLGNGRLLCRADGLLSVQKLLAGLPELVPGGV